MNFTGEVISTDTDANRPIINDVNNVNVRIVGCVVNAKQVDAKDDDCMYIACQIAQGVKPPHRAALDTIP